MKMNLDHTTLQEKVTANIRKSILLRDFQPGERLVQEELAESLGVSRMPIREALRKLESEGLIEMIPHKGAFVSAICKEDIAEIYELRAILEGIAVEKSSGNLMEEDILELEQLHRQMDQAISVGDIDRFVEHNSEFHQRLREGCQWKRINRIIQHLWNGYPPYAPSLLPATIRRSNEEHLAMIHALKENRPEKLGQLMASHIRRTGEGVKQFFD